MSPVYGYPVIFMLGLFIGVALMRLMNMARDPYEDSDDFLDSMDEEELRKNVKVGLSHD